MKRINLNFLAVTMVYIMSWLIIFSCGVSGISIVKNGSSRAVISVPGNASKQVNDAADILSEYIEKSTGAKLTVETDGNDKKKVTIHVGEDDFTKSLNLFLKDIDIDGFLISFPDRKNIVIAGQSDWGTEFGIYEFLERFAGVRWLMIGPDGDDVPEHQTLTIPMVDIRQEPRYFSRHLGFLVEHTFVRRNRIHDFITGHMAFERSAHNLANLFPSSKYLETHPEFYPVLDGKRYRPKSDTDWYGWEPCFSADGIVEEAVKNIKDYFKENPGIVAYSLGMNDNDKFCQCERCLAKVPSENNFLGYRNYSNSYFEWANKVVEGVIKEYPDKWFSTIAYWNLVQPPDKIQVHPRIVPYMTY